MCAGSGKPGKKRRRRTRRCVHTKQTRTSEEGLVIRSTPSCAHNSSSHCMRPTGSKTRPVTAHKSILASDASCALSPGFVWCVWEWVFGRAEHYHRRGEGCHTMFEQTCANRMGVRTRQRSQALPTSCKSGTRPNADVEVPWVADGRMSW